MVLPRQWLDIKRIKRARELAYEFFVEMLLHRAGVRGCAISRGRDDFKWKVSSRTS